MLSKCHFIQGKYTGRVSSWNGLAGWKGTYRYICKFEWGGEVAMHGSWINFHFHQWSAQECLLDPLWPSKKESRGQLTSIPLLGMKTCQRLSFCSALNKNDCTQARFLGCTNGAQAEGYTALDLGQDQVRGTLSLLQPFFLLPESPVAVSLPCSEPFLCFSPPPK